MEREESTRKQYNEFCNVIETYFESKEVTRDEIKSLRALTLTAETWGFGENILLGVGRSNTYTCLFKTQDSKWVIWDMSKMEELSDVELFDEVKSACNKIIDMANLKHSDVAHHDFERLCKSYVSEESLVEYAFDNRFKYEADQMRLKKHFN